ALLTFEVELDPVAFLLGGDETECVAAEAVHMTIGSRDAAVAHNDGDLMQCFGKRGPEVPVILGAAQVCAWIAFHCMIEVGEFQRITQEEDRGVVADKVPVAFLGIKFDREAANVAFGICGSSLTGDCGEPDKQVGGFSYLRENLGSG